MTTNPSKIIHNVATLDLRTATPAAIAGIRRIDNVATVIYSAETASLVAGLSLGNVASMVKVPANAKLILGQETLGADSFAGQTEPIQLVVVGQLTVQSDVTVAALEAGLASLAVYGQLLYPNHLAGVLKAKLSEISGQMQVYAANAKIVSGKLDLTETYLHGLEDNSELLVFGKLNATQVLPNDLLAQKLKKVEVFGRVVCSEENGAVLLGRTTASTVTTIPAGFVYLERPIELDANLLSGLPGKKLCGRSLRILPDVTAEALDAAVDALVISGEIIAPAALRAVLARKGNLLEARAIFYEGELWLVDNTMTLLPERFDYLEGQATLVVFGELRIAPEVEPKTLAARFHKVHNWGEIFCTPGQMTALQARLGVNEGEFVHPSAGASEENEIGNVAFLAL